MDSILPLITNGDLVLGQMLTCSLPGVTAEVVPEVLRMQGLTTAAPTEPSNSQISRPAASTLATRVRD